MRLKPRHYILCAVVIAIFAVNVVRNRHHRAATTANAPVMITGPRASTPAWAAFDTAASMRDLPDDKFLPALHDLQQLSDASHEPADKDIPGCQTWLLFYRQGVIHPARDQSWKDRSAHHLAGCIQYHLDVPAP
jgi:hypothetical protein